MLVFSRLGYFALCGGRPEELSDESLIRRKVPLDSSNLFNSPQSVLILGYSRNFLYRTHVILMAIFDICQLVDLIKPPALQDMVVY